MTPLPRQSSKRKAKSKAEVLIASQSVMESLNDNEWSYNTNPDAYGNNGRESEGGRRALFTSSDDIPLGDTAMPIPKLATTKSVSCIAPSRGEQDKENNSPVGSLDDETAVSLGEALRFTLEVENSSPVGLAGTRDGLLTPSTIKPTIAAPTVRLILSSRADRGKQNHSPPVGNIGDETVVSPSQELKANLDVKPNIAVGLLGVRAGLLTPPNEDQRSYKYQMDQVVRQLPEEVGKRNILQIERQYQMDHVVRQLTREFVKRDNLWNERTFWVGEMARVLEQVDVEFLGPDMDAWDLRNEQAFWKGEMARVLEQVDVEFFGPYWDDWDDL
jgi:hypothetical protein